VSGALLAAALCVAASVGVDGAARESLVGSSKDAVRIDASNSVVLGMRWDEGLVRTGFYRKVIESFGSPGISTRYGLVIVGQGEGAVLALRLRDGKEVWRYEHGVPFETSVSILPESERLPELAIATSRDGAVLALAVETGELLWTGNVGADVRAPALLVEDTLFLTTSANKIHALDIQTGKSKWTDGRPPASALTVEGHSAPAYHDGVVYAAFADGYVEAFRAADGVRLWSRPLSFVGGEFIDADADPIVIDGRLFVASYSDGVYALELDDGKTIWSKPAPSVTTLAPFDDGDRHYIIAASADGYIWGLDRATGNREYRVRLPPGPMSRLRVHEGFAAVAAGKAGLVVIDAGTGRPLQATAVTGWLGNDLAWEGDWAAALGSTGRLYTFSLGDAGLVK